jgi:hypothetical protein
VYEGRSLSVEAGRRCFLSLSGFHSSLTLDTGRSHGTGKQAFVGYGPAAHFTSAVRALVDSVESLSNVDHLSLKIVKQTHIGLALNERACVVGRMIVVGVVLVFKIRGRLYGEVTKLDDPFVEPVAIGFQTGAQIAF